MNPGLTGRSTMDQLFTLRQLAEKYSEKRKPLYCCYIDYQKAFDTVWQYGGNMVASHAASGLPTKYCWIPEGTLRYLPKRCQSEWWAEILVHYYDRSPSWMYTVPQLLNILLELVLSLAIQEEQMGAKVQEQYINNLRFADDIVLLAESEEDLQSLVTKVGIHSKKFGLTRNISASAAKQKFKSSTEKTYRLT